MDSGFHRAFVLSAHGARAEVRNINDLVAGRADLLARCVVASLQASAAVRLDSAAYLVCDPPRGGPAGTLGQGGAGDGSSRSGGGGGGAVGGGAGGGEAGGDAGQQRVVVTVRGAEVENLRPDERHVASQLQWLLSPPSPSKQKVHQYRRTHVRGGGGGEQQQQQQQQQQEEEEEEGGARCGCTEEEARAALLAKGRRCLRGFDAHPGDLRAALDAAAAAAAVVASALPRRLPVLLLLEEGAPALLPLLLGGGGALAAEVRARGVLLLLGGSTGLTAADVAEAEAWCAAACGDGAAAAAAAVGGDGAGDGSGNVAGKQGDRGGLVDERGGRARAVPPAAAPTSPPLTPPPALLRVSLGRTSLLASQCITIAHFLLDSL
jgi:tRNA pseudouridine-54 N-methylase